MRRLAFALALAACDPEPTIDVSVAIPAELAGKPILVIEYNDATATSGLPAPRSPAIVWLATTATDSTVTTEIVTRGCPSSWFVAAWVDATGGDLAALLAGHTYVYDDSPAPHALYAQLLALAPQPGDYLGVSGAIDFGHHVGGCDVSHTSVDLALVMR